MNTNQKVAASSRASAEIRRCSSCRRGAAVIFPEWAACGVVTARALVWAVWGRR